ncbi:MAG: ATP-dependent DNA helicase RecG [Oscillospiraceae bacterium]|nr:ATP-dependent DNA helicase RecG [Oscillospiraceae bacterium]
MDIQFLKGVGEKRAKLYNKLGVFTVEDLLYHLPRTYIDLSSPCDIAAAFNTGEDAAVRLRVIHKSSEQRIRKGLSVFKVKAVDDVSTLTVSFFNTKYTVDSLIIGKEYIFYGKIGGSLLKPEMTSPQVFPCDLECGFIPIYPLTAGLTSKIIASQMRQALSNSELRPADPIPENIRAAAQLCTLDYALENIHFPQNSYAANISRQRLIFEELFVFSLAMASVRGKNRRSSSRPMQTVDIDRFYSSLPFTPTNGQLQAVSDISNDLTSSQPMNRLIQGDVGCGKTLVAAAAVYMAVKNGYQAAMMAPTEILAEQHLHAMSSFLQKHGIKVALLTGSMTKKQKDLVKEQLKTSQIDLCVGTHALISADAHFANLGLVITDEQHRFGVAQRTELSNKGSVPHVLVMSATPIPRTLALILYGDLDISVIRELPKGRQPIKTYAITPEKRLRAFGFIREHLSRGLQGYIVCPLIEAGEVDMGLQTASEYSSLLIENGFDQNDIGILHGKMKPKDKDAVMSDFKNGKIKLLVSTTVIEVGVDVPNAVIMMIEDAHRFGLSQLHQLRGRVGRGCEQSHCILVSDASTPEAAARLKVLCKTTDGFKVAEEDLKQRGPGDFLGIRQHGMPQLKFADLSRDAFLLSQAQTLAHKLINDTNGLKGESFAPLRRRVRRILDKVGERPN